VATRTIGGFVAAGFSLAFFGWATDAVDSVCRVPRVTVEARILLDAWIRRTLGALPSAVVVRCHAEARRYESFGIFRRL